MKDKFIRLLKAIGIVAMLFAVFFLIIFGVFKYPKITAIIAFALVFVYLVWRVYESANLD